MNLDIELDDRFWAFLPPEFPWRGLADPEEWTTELLRRYLTVRPEAPADERDRVRSIGETAVDVLAPEAEFGLLFWPAARPQAALVEVETARPIGSRESLRAALVPSVPLALPPSIDALEAPGVGPGLLARFALPSRPGEPPLAGLSAVVSGPAGAVRLSTAPTTPLMVGLLEPHVRAVLSTMRFADTASGPVS